MAGSRRSRRGWRRRTGRRRSTRAGGWCCRASWTCTATWASRGTRTARRWRRGRGRRRRAASRRSAAWATRRRGWTRAWSWRRCGRAAETAAVRVLPIGCVTRGRDGSELAELAELARAGAVAFSDDPRPVRSSRLLRHALAYSAMLSRPVVEHAVDSELAEGGLAHEGRVATWLGLP